MRIQTRSKKLMVLGAGVFQIPGIRKAVELGYYVISVDDRPESVGHKYSHQFLNCSTADREELARQARALAVDGICTFSSDIAVPSVGYVCDRLDLPGVSFNAAQIMCMKHRFREAQRLAGMAHPQFVAAQSLEGLLGVDRVLRCPIVIKPVDSSGSRGLRTLAGASVDAVAAAFAVAKSFSTAGMVCVEEFVSGRECSGDGILIDGELSFARITDKYLNAFAVTGHSVPSTLSDHDQQRVRSAVEDCCKAVGYDRGPLDFDVKVAPDRVVVLEMSPRTGGNGIPAVITRATGVDVEEATIRLALGEAWRPPETGGAGQHRRRAGSLIFGSQSGGTLTKAGSFAQVRQSVPELIELNFAVPIGSPVRPFEHNGNLIGYAVFDCEPPATYADVAQRIADALDIQVDAGPV
ncbi:ATP-grasp domain-containing protein [Methyloceanibacter sp.]|uniref:ATP-grasp domain-containing protein n=1 Tax=Methyloceanibacter sp. TaxID=1965321 RepID=UPI003D6D1A32